VAARRRAAATALRGDKAATAAARKRHSSRISRQAKIGSTTPRKAPSIQNYKGMSGSDKVKAAATMYGTGSKQHKAAQKRFGR
jgi:hypothetical protein